ncbi:MAG: tripartite tricarboxylate transporter TctB family protein, partial [Rhodobacterales bacterium]|nr:tripartite tricarboxylate transporter TctB family protein [Rhodobacterales bacterium]
MSTSRMARADFLSAIVFFVLGIYMVFEGLRMPGAGGFIETGGEPGRVPVLVGGVIALFALVLLVRSVRQGGHRRARDGDGMSDADRAQARVGTLRSLLAAVGCSVYAVGLLGAHIGGFSVSYPLATGLFILLFIMGFEWADAPEAGARRWAQLAARAPGLADALAR